MMDALGEVGESVAEGAGDSSATPRSCLGLSVPQCSRCSHIFIGA
jgi:hypothetical protein